ncbi:LLM class flavin-dependent oxidoreductase [Phytoactinopolyspora halotolerans]|uniref:LLM class flavin-dependent oxidoreductase n=1 Tax=Phytoactinopolyspora halotolerans TaxID=1981512 RepID=A0A6L9S6Q3_9ACTN|nr:LLM class flavin-dependent oxidoreductase [Phytoactinopolyspora halotolerans]NED99669.1 LLM class flavin-dependent oxidoreductase [Phytoactinopolyspora halotolerans]
MPAKEFRFGAAVGLVPTSKDLLGVAARIEQLGFSTMVMADGLWLPSPFPALSAVAAATSSLRLGTQVLAAPFRSPATVAHETATIDMISDHRFELGLGIGTPDAAADAERLGMPFGTATERRAHLAATIAAVKEHFAASHQPTPRILLGGIGPKLVELAVAEADTLTIPVPYQQTRDDLAAKVKELRAGTDPSFDDLELAVNLLIIGDNELPEWVPPKFRELPAHSYGRLTGTPAQMANALRRNRDEFGISYVTVPQWSIEDFAPVVEMLSGT